ncbi:MAG TPA: class I SAM-dependent methyltransferase [Terriglobales bacterium]|nr:class I SAM-dependent methyltransferase [Terriglobales bacterium]
MKSRSMSLIDSKQRFSSRVDNYVRFRPSYPTEVFDTLERECGLTRDSAIADIASGTGIFTKLLLEHGNRVFGVEPNPDMRRAGEEFLSQYPRFTSVNGTAESTTLPDASVDFVTAAQAGHWFDIPKASREFTRILEPEGWLVLVWNERQTDLAPFLRDYEQLLLRYGTDYNEVRHEHAAVGTFYDPHPCQERTFELRQEFDYEGVKGRLLSSSYAPGPEHPNHPAMLAELRRIFDLRQRNGKVSFDYITRLYYGRLA